MDKKIAGIFLRYALILIIVIPNFQFLSNLLFYVTVPPSYFFIKIFFKDAILIGNFINFRGLSLEIISACLALSAYLLLVILNLSTPINIKARLNALTFSVFTLLILNILRITILASIYLTYPKAFNFTHLATWYLLSVIFVVGIWFLTVKIFKINKIPFVDDLKYLYSKSNLKRKFEKKKTR